MKYYKNIQGEVFAYETEEECQEWGAPDLVAMTPVEVDEHLNPQPTTEQLAARGRTKRDAALSVLDVFVSNPLRYSELSTKQKEEAAEYRQALLGIPQQETFPQSYKMPEAPTWL